MNFNQAINKSILKVLSKSKKNFLMGLEVTNTGNEYYEKFPKQVLETPVSELSSSGLAVGPALKGYKPQIVFGRVEFALLAFDQIFTQAGRMEFTFGGKIKCPVSFRIQIGRQWGNGPNTLQITILFSCRVMVLIYLYLQHLRKHIFKTSSLIN